MHIAGSIATILRLLRSPVFSFGISLLTFIRITYLLNLFTYSDQLFGSLKLELTHSWRDDPLRKSERFQFQQTQAAIHLLSARPRPHVNWEFGSESE